MTFQLGYEQQKIPTENCVQDMEDMIKILPRAMFTFGSQGVSITSRCSGNVPAPLPLTRHERAAEIEPRI